MFEVKKWKKWFKSSEQHKKICEESRRKGKQNHDKFIGW
jgi:hypothetical protein